ALRAAGGTKGSHSASRGPPPSSPHPATPAPIRKRFLHELEIGTGGIGVRGCGIREDRGTWCRSGWYRAPGARRVAEGCGRFGGVRGVLAATRGSGGRGVLAWRRR